MSRDSSIHLSTSGVSDPSSVRSRHRPGWYAPGACAVLVLGLVLLGWGWKSWIRPARNPDELWREAERAFQAGRYEQAEALLQRISWLREPTPLDLMLRAQFSMLRGRNDDALAELAMVPEGHYMAAQSRLMIGQIELRRNRARFAEAAFREASRLDPKLVNAHREMIYIYGVQLRRAALNEEFRALAELTDLTFDNAFHWCLLRTAVWDSAVIEDLDRFLAADPEDRWSRLALAENYRRTGLLDQAESTLTPLPESDPEALAIRVMMALDRHQIDVAEQLLGTGAPDLPDLARLRGRLALSRRDAATAARQFRIAYTHDPLNRDTLFGLVNALTMLGDENAAAPFRETLRNIETLNTLVQRAATPFERENPELLRALGAACASLRFDPEARAWYKLAIARNPLDTESQQALFRLNARSKPMPDPPDPEPREPSPADRARG